MPESRSSPRVTSAPDLAARLTDEMAAAWERGERPRAEDLLALHDLSDDDAIRLIYEEACLRREHDESSVTAEILGRFPRWRDRLALLLECDRLMRPLPAAQFPSVGDVLGDFHLQAEIGRGSIGRTFLACQRSLADRRVVLKATPLIHDEHLSLARLRHTNIVPIYFEQAVPDRRIRLIGMPYLGGATLSRVLGDEILSATPPGLRTGRQILESLDRAAASLPRDDSFEGPFRAFMAQASYVQVVCWIGACLADALQYAHAQNLIHLDVKPSNVQLAGDGQPVLLDFHLASAPIGPGRPAPDRLGGTVGFLSPEQQAAMDALGRGLPIEQPIDGRSDIYSLGLVLHQALGGAREPAAARDRSRPTLVSLNPNVSPGLSDVIEKCLERDPSNRYPDAASLAGDLRRHLSNQPLRGVSNRSPLERWRKWRRRSPIGVLRLALIPALVATIVVGVVLFRKWNREIDDALATAERHLANNRYDDAALTLKQALDLAAMVPMNAPRKQWLKAQSRRVENERIAAELHDLVNSLRFSAASAGNEAARALLKRGQDVIALRDRFAESRNEPLSPESARRIKADLLDLAIIQASQAARATGGKEAGPRVAAGMLLEARARLGSSPALGRDLGRYLAQIGESDPSPVAVPPRTPWEHYDLGKSYLQSREIAAAEQAFRRSVELDPGEFWPQFYWGVCAYRLGRFHDAAGALSAAIALQPAAAECYYNRAKAYEGLNAVDRARADYSRALELKPTFADAALNRGTMAYREGRLDDALADLERARANAETPETLGLVAYNLALVHLKNGDRSTAGIYLKQAIKQGNAQAQALASRLDPPHPSRPSGPATR